MKQAFTAVLLTFVMANITGCSEQPQRVVSERGQAYNVENGVSPLHERTLTQGESRRLAY